MRHFLLTGAVATLPFGVGVTSATAALIATTCCAHCASPGVLGATCGAVAVAAITVATDQYGGAATSAQVASSGCVHWQWWANGVGVGDACVMTYFVRNVVPGRRGLRGAASELAWRLVPMSRLRFHRPVSFLPHPQHICRASLARRRLLRNPSAGCPAGSKS
jgi:hypothetical protein